MTRMIRKGEQRTTVPSPLYTPYPYMYCTYNMGALQLTVMTRRRRQTRICADNRNSCVRQCFNLCKGKNFNWNRNDWMIFPRKARELRTVTDSLFNLVSCWRKWKIPSWDVVVALLVSTPCPGNRHPRGNPVESNSQLQLTVIRAWFDFWPQNHIQTLNNYTICCCRCLSLCVVVFLSKIA